MNDKTMELIAIGASIGAHCQPCLAYHVNKAQEMGIAEEEIREAIAVGHMVEKGATAAMKSYASGLFTQQPSSGTCCCAGEKTGSSRGCCN